MAYLRSQLVPSEQTPKLNVARDAAAFLALASWPFASVFFFFLASFQHGDQTCPSQAAVLKNACGARQSTGWQSGQQHVTPPHHPTQ